MKTIGVIGGMEIHVKATVNMHWVMSDVSY